MDFIKSVAVLLSAGLLVPSAYAATPSIKSTANFSEKSVWKVDSHKGYDVLSNCQGGLACITSKMKKMGASTSAIQFTKAVEPVGTGYLESFKEKGIVDLGSATYLRANTNTEYVMLNGSPNIVHTEVDTVKGIDKDPLYKSAIKKYKDLLFWGSSAEFKNLTQDKTGIHYLFSYPMLNGCHACENPYNALVQFNFNKQGKFLGHKFVKLVKN